MQTCVFEGSDRARALLYRVIEINLVKARSEFVDALRTAEDTFRSMKRSNFGKEELDLARGERRVGAVRKVLQVDARGEQRT
jgi:hypothetical protein